MSEGMEFHENTPLALRFVESNQEPCECVYCESEMQPGKVVAAFFKADKLIGPVCEMCLHTFAELPFVLK